MFVVFVVVVVYENRSSILNSLLGTTLRIKPGGHDGITLSIEYKHNIYIGYIFPY